MKKFLVHEIQKANRVTLCLGILGGEGYPIKLFVMGVVYFEQCQGFNKFSPDINQPLGACHHLEVVP